MIPNPPRIHGATRLDPDGLVVEVTVIPADSASVAQLRALVSDPDLRFRAGG
ncbi:MAG TPA: hypothetical protein VHH15_19215 [Actinophytocola sp.]|nr:hypothetical protein [Actinophytocola sp.]